MKGRIVLTVIGGLFAIPVVFVLRLLGVPVEFSIAWLLAAVVIGIALRQEMFDESSSWPPEERKAPVRGSEVSRLAWSLDARSGAAGPAIVRRVERLVRRGAARHGLDLEDPDHRDEIERLFGPGVTAALASREPRREDIETVLDAVEESMTRNEER